MFRLNPVDDLCGTFYILDFPYRSIGEKYEEDFRY